MSDENQTTPVNPANSGQNDDDQDFNLDINFDDLDLNLKGIDNKDENISDFGDILLDEEIIEKKEEKTDDELGFTLSFDESLEQSHPQGKEEPKESEKAGEGDFDFTIPSFDESFETEQPKSQAESEDNIQELVFDDELSAEDAVDEAETVLENEVDTELQETSFELDLGEANIETAQEETIQEEPLESVDFDFSDEGISEQEQTIYQENEQENVLNLEETSFNALEETPIETLEEMTVEAENEFDFGDELSQGETQENLETTVQQENIEENTSSLNEEFSFNLDLDSDPNEGAAPQEIIDKIQDKQPEINSPTIIINEYEKAKIEDLDNNESEEMENKNQGGIDLSSMDIAPNNITNSLDALDAKMKEPESVKERLTKINAAGIQAKASKQSGGFIKRFIFLIILSALGYVVYAMMSGSIGGKADMLGGLFGSKGGEQTQVAQTDSSTGTQDETATGDETDNSEAIDEDTGSEEDTSDTAAEEDTGSTADNSDDASDTSSESAIDDTGSDDSSTASDSGDSSSDETGSTTASQDDTSTSSDSSTDSASSDTTTAYDTADTTVSQATTKPVESQTTTSSAKTGTTQQEETIHADDINSSSPEVQSFQKMADSADAIIKLADGKKSTLAKSFATVAKTRAQEAIKKLENGENIDITESQKYIQKFLDSATAKLNAN